MKTLDEELLKRLASVATTAISDVLDTLGINGGLPGILPTQPGASCFGPAYCVKFEPAVPGESAPAADYLDDVPPGSVIVLDNGGRVDCTVWGDILTLCAEQRGLAGTVINGCCRDVAVIRQMDYPVFSVSRFMKSGKNRARMVAVREPLSIGPTKVMPGDYVRADDSGVICIPKERLREVHERVIEVEAMEELVRTEVKRGTPLREARKKHGYDRFSLQPASHAAGAPALSRA